MKSKAFAIAAGIPAALLVGLFCLVFLLTTGSRSAASACTAPAAQAGASGTAAVDGYRGVQLTNAAAIMNAAVSMHLDVQAEVVGVMTAMGESDLEVLEHGDAAGPDSRGLFQQRASWGSLADRLDPTASADLFYARLATIPDWELLSPTIAAHQVQGNADPDFYAAFYPAAQAVVASLGATTTDCATTTAAGDDYPWADQPTEADGGGLSPLGYYYRECVDFVAWRLNRDAGTSTAPWTYTWATLTPLGGDAIDWKQNWIAHGWTVSSTPEPGAVAWWGTDAGPAGHVAYVQSVSTSGQVVLEEYNWGDNHTYDQRTIPASGADAYLYPPPKTR